MQRAHLEELRERDQTLRVGLDLQPGEGGVELFGQVAVLAPRVAEPFRRRLELVERDAALAVSVEDVVDRDVIGDHLLLELQLAQVQPACDGAHPPVGLLHRVGCHDEHLRAVGRSGTHRKDLGVLCVAPQAALPGSHREELAMFLRTARGVDGLAADAAAAGAQVAQVPLLRTAARTAAVWAAFELPPEPQRVQVGEWQLPHRALVRVRVSGQGWGWGWGWG